VTVFSCIRSFRSFGWGRIGLGGPVLKVGGVLIHIHQGAHGGG